MREVQASTNMNAFEQPMKIIGGYNKKANTENNFDLMYMAVKINLLYAADPNLEFIYRI